jgi:hypothetical protein
MWSPGKIGVQWALLQSFGAVATSVISTAVLTNPPVSTRSTRPEFAVFLKGMTRSEPVRTD